MTPRLIYILEAIRKNIITTRGEEYDFDVDRVKEGDGRIALILFIGIATEYGYEPYDIMVFLNVQRKEFQYKLGEYQKKTDRRFQNKRKLIINYLKLKYNAEAI